MGHTITVHCKEREYERRGILDISLINNLSNSDCARLVSNRGIRVSRASIHLNQTVRDVETPNSRCGGKEVCACRFIKCERGWLITWKDNLDDTRSIY